MADPQVYPGGVIAKLLNLTERRLQQLAKEGVVPKAERGKYPLVESVRGYIKYLQERAVGRDAAPIDVNVERTRLLRAQADLAEAEAARVRGELVPVGLVTERWISIAASIKARVLALESAIVARLPPEQRAAIRPLIAEELEAALRELSRDDEPSGDDRPGGTGDAQGVPPAAAPDGERVGGPLPAAVT